MKFLAYLFVILAGTAIVICLLPFILFFLLLQLLMGRPVVRTGYFRRSAPREPEQPETEVPASEAIIDAEVVDLPDGFIEIENDTNSQKTQ